MGEGGPDFRAFRVGPFKFLANRTRPLRGQWDTLRQMSATDRIAPWARRCAPKRSA